MGNKKITISTSKESKGEERDMVELCADTDDLHRQNQTLEDKFLHIQQRQHEVNLRNEVDMIYP